MNIFLWVLQVLLALHTLMGALWKFSNSTQIVPSLRAIPQSVWLGLSGVEIVCAIALVVPALSISAAPAVPIAATAIALEMLVFCALHLGSGRNEHGQMIYWLVVAAVCGFIAYGRWVLRPLGQ